MTAPIPAPPPEGPPAPEQPATAYPPNASPPRPVGQGAPIPSPIAPAIPPPVAPAPPKAPQGRRLLILALVVAVIVALAAIVVAAYEAGRAAQSPAAPRATGQPAPGGQPTPTGQPPTGPGATQPPAALTPTPNAVPSDINPSALFTPAYQPQQQLQLRPGGSCTTLYVDLDEPRVNVASTIAEFSLYTCGSDLALSFQQETTVSVAASPNTTPNECAESIRTSALSGNARVPVQPNTFLCVATSRPAALEKGITWKIALIVIKAIGSDQTVTLLVSAWNIPG
jgi:hypothetical protein